MKANKIIFTVALDFNDEFDVIKGSQDIASKIADSLEHTVNHSADGIAPEEAETFTRNIIVKNPYCKEEHRKF